MSEEFDRKGHDAALWARARTAWVRKEGAGGLDPLDLAAYLDGTLDSAARETVEAALLADPVALDTLIAARAALTELGAAAPEAVVRRGQNVRAPLGGARAGAGSRSHTLIAWFGALGRAGAWAGVAAALLLASVSGFEMGRTGAWHMAALDAAVGDDVRLVLGGSTQDLL